VTEKHECDENCGPRTRVMCWKCQVRVDIVRQAHVGEVFTRHSKLCHDADDTGTKPTQKPASC
jgi:hypothetical protein